MAKDFPGKKIDVVVFDDEGNIEMQTAVFSFNELINELKQYLPKFPRVELEVLDD